MKISIVCVGKIKEKYLTAGIAEFTKRLAPYCKLETIAIGEEKMPDNPSPAEKEQVLAKETERLLNAIPQNAHVVLLDLQGKEVTSPQLAELMDKGEIEFFQGDWLQGVMDAIRLHSQAAEASCECRESRRGERVNASRRPPFREWRMKLKRPIRQFHPNGNVLSHSLASSSASFSIGLSKRTFGASAAPALDAAPTAERRAASQNSFIIVVKLHIG